MFDLWTGGVSGLCMKRTKFDKETCPAKCIICGVLLIQCVDPNLLWLQFVNLVQKSELGHNILDLCKELIN